MCACLISDFTARTRACIPYTHYMGVRPRLNLCQLAETKHPPPLPYPPPIGTATDFHSCQHLVSYHGISAQHQLTQPTIYSIYLYERIITIWISWGLTGGQSCFNLSRHEGHSTGSRVLPLPLDSYGYKHNHRCQGTKVEECHIWSSRQTVHVMCQYATALTALVYSHYMTHHSSIIIQACQSSYLDSF